jgi:hypothetical protein
MPVPFEWFPVSVVKATVVYSVNTGSATDANALLVPQPLAEQGMDAAVCIGAEPALPPVLMQRPCPL